MGQIKNKLALSMFHVPHSYRAIFSQSESLRKNTVQRGLRIFNLICYQIFLSRKTKKKTQGLTKLIQTYEGCRVLLVANGPSVRGINFTKLSEIQALNQIVIVGINYSPLALVEKYRKDIKLDLLILSDYFMHPRNTDRKNQEFWDIVDKDSIKIVTPTAWCDSKSFVQCRDKICLHFNDYGTEGIFSHINPTKTRNYISLTAFKALAICRYLRFSKIYLIGLDNNFFLGMNVDKNLNLIEMPHHAGPTYSGDYNVSSFWPKGLGDYFYFVSKIFIDLRKYFNYENIINLDIDSLNDVHKKIERHDEFYKLISPSRKIKHVK